MAAKIFLNYAREDQSAVKHLYEKLTEAGFKPWMDAKDILPGEKWGYSLEKAIGEADLFLACLSKNSINKRGFVQREIRTALDKAQGMLESDIYFIPVRLDNSEIVETFRAYQWVDLFEADGWERLIRAIYVGMERRSGSAEQEQNVEETSEPLVEFGQETTINHGPVKFYRGAGVGTYWHVNDARVLGLIPQSPQEPPTIAGLAAFIARAQTVTTPYVSLTRSYGVARAYAMLGGRRVATKNDPAYVYEIEFNNPLPSGVHLLDPIKEIARILPPPFSPVSYQHNGEPDFLLGLLDPSRFRHRPRAYQVYPDRTVVQPSGPSIYLEAMVRGMRDAEILAYGHIPAACVVDRYPES